MSNITYLKKIIDKLKAQKIGLENNNAAWVGQPETPAAIQLHIDELQTLNDDIAALKIQLKQKLLAARQLAKTKTTVANAQELKIKGIHASETEKWREYGVSKPALRTKGKRPVPTKGIIENIMNDKDGAGFIIKCRRLKDAYSYEFEKAVSENASDDKHIPAFSHFKSSTKTKLVDDDVEKGKRYFYRYRGVNSKGFGEWSTSISAVQ